MLKKIQALALILAVGLSINGIVFAQETENSDGNLPPCVEENEGENVGGVLISDFTGVLISDRNGVLISDFYGWIAGDSDDKDCRKTTDE